MKFSEILSQFDIPTAPSGHHHARQGWTQIDCPYCGKDSKKWHMGYSIEYKFFNCWRCGSHPLVNTLMEITGSSYREINKLLGDLDKTKIKAAKKTGKLIIPKGVVSLKPAHKMYLQHRGFQWRKIEQTWQVKGLGVASKRLSWRLFIPIIYHSEIVSWTTRSISNSDQTDRYITASKSEESKPHRQLLYGEDFVRHAVIVVEGVFDVWRIGQGAVCTFGSGYSLEQLERITKYPIRAICFDNEREAQKRARRLSDDLSVFPGETFNFVLDSKDPAEESEENIKRLRKEILE